MLTWDEITDIAIVVSLGGGLLAIVIWSVVGAARSQDEDNPWVT